MEYTLSVRYLNNSLILVHGCFINRGVAHDISSGCISVCTPCQCIRTGVSIKEGRYDRVLSDQTSTGLVSVLLLGNQCTADFYEEKTYFEMVICKCLQTSWHAWHWLHQEVLRQRILQESFWPRSLGGKWNVLILKEVSALWTDYIDCFTYMAKSTGAFPYLIFAFFHW